MANEGKPEQTETTDTATAPSDVVMEADLTSGETQQDGSSPSDDVATTPSKRTRLGDACDNASELVAYLSSKGNLPPDITNAAFFSILDKARTQTLTPSEEQEFWNGYSQLAAFAEPVQIEALKFRSFILDRTKADGSDQREYKRSLSAIIRIRFTSLMSFAMSLLLLTYVSLTSTYLSTNNGLTKEHQLIQAGVFTGTRLEGIDKNARNDPLSFGDNSGSEGDEQSSRVEDPFSDNLSPDFSIFQTLSQDALTEIQNHIEYNLGALVFLQFHTGSIGRQEANTNLGDIAFSRVILQQAQIEAHQGLLNQLVSSYLLPLFTSLLGVTVFILRRTSASLNSGQYRLYESSTYSYRMTLGVVGGIVISWFATSDTSGVIGSLTPAALAFIVGYSIEVLYNVLDSIVKALGGASDK